MLIVILNLLVACQAASTAKFPFSSHQPTSSPISMPPISESPSPIFSASAKAADDGSETITPTGFFPGFEIKLILFSSVVVLVLIAVVGYLWLAERPDEDNHPEYTRAILGADTFEFSPMENL
jgi:hypothetical protein